MKNSPLVTVFSGFVATVMGVTVGAWGLDAAAQERVYRCANNEYTNNEADAKVKGCKIIEGASVTIVSAPRAAPQPVARAGNAPTASASRVNDSAEQRARDSDARLILEGELRKSEEKLTDLKREYNSGEPEKRGEEFRNNQRYIDRVADLKAAIGRSESDITSLKRELTRAPAAAPTSGNSGGNTGGTLGAGTALGSIPTR